MEYISANEAHYWLADVATGAKTELTLQREKNVAYGKALFADDNKGVYFITDKENEFARLAYMDIATRNITYLTSAINWDVESFDLSSNHSQLAFATNEAGFSKMYLLNTGNKQYKQVTTLPPGVYSDLTFNSDKKSLAVTVSSAKSPADIFVISTSNGKTERWTESEMGGIAGDLTTPELIKWPGFDNKEIIGFLLSPS